MLESCVKMRIHFITEHLGALDPVCNMYMYREDGYLWEYTLRRSGFI